MKDRLYEIIKSHSPPGAEWYYYATCSYLKLVNGQPYEYNFLTKIWEYSCINPYVCDETSSIKI